MIIDIIPQINACWEQLYSIGNIENKEKIIINKNYTKFILSVSSTICGEGCFMEFSIHENDKEIKKFKELFFTGK